MKMKDLLTQICVKKMDQVIHLRTLGHHNECFNKIKKLLSPKTFEEIVQDIEHNYEGDIPKLIEELSIIIYYVPEISRELRYQVSEWLLLNHHVQINRELVNRNLVHYVLRLTPKRVVPLPLDMPLIEDTNVKYRRANPSIIYRGKTYLVCCRGVNYTQQFARNFISSSPDGKIRTINVLAAYDKEFNYIHSWILRDISNRPKYESLIVGFEDVQIFEYNGRIHFFATTIDSMVPTMVKMGIGRLSDDFLNVEHFQLLEGPEKLRVEKNWLPWVVEDKLYIIYGYDPFTVYQLKFEDGQYTLTNKLQIPVPILMDTFRGSGNPVEFLIQDTKGYLLAVHEVSFQDYGRVYLHRLVWFSEDFSEFRVSRLFYFEQHGVEFCRGLCYDGSDVILSVGLNDAEASLYFLTREQVINMLKTL